MNRKTNLKLWLLIILIVFPFFASAHFAPDLTPKTLKTKALIIDPDLFVVGIETEILLEVKDSLKGTFVPNLKPEIKIEDANGKIIFNATANPRDNDYLFEYTFQNGGDYTIHVSFPYQNQEQNFDFKIFVSEPVSKNSLIPTIIIAIAILLILTSIIIGLRKKKIKAAVISSILIIFLAALGYSLYVALEQNPGLGIVTCTSTGACFWTAHIHAYLPISICGEEYRLPIEVGQLDKAHTHEEKNIAHWHDRLPYDYQKQAITNTKPLTIGAFFDSIDINFGETQIANKKNGDLCRDHKLGKVSMFVNGILNNQFRDYIWKDHDVISIFFDTRPIEEIQSEVKEKNITFPKLGRG